MINLLFRLLFVDCTLLIKLYKISRVQGLNAGFLQVFYWPAFRKKLLQILLCWSLAHCVTRPRSCRSMPGQIKNKMKSLYYYHYNNWFLKQVLSNRGQLWQGTPFQGQMKKRNPLSCFHDNLPNRKQHTVGHGYCLPGADSQESSSRERRQQLLTLKFKCQLLLKLITQAPAPSAASTSPQSFFSLPLSSFTNTSFLDPHSYAFTIVKKSFRVPKRQLVSVDWEINAAEMSGENYV